MASTEEQRAKWHEQYKARYERDPDYFKRRALKYYEANKERRLVAMREYAAAHPEKVRGHKRKWAEVNDRVARDRRLRRVYGISLDEYEAMNAVQGGLCLICGQPEGLRVGKNGRARTTRLVVDHDPSSGRVRGLLCRWCNRFIGFFDHDPERMRRAADYLER